MAKAVADVDKETQGGFASNDGLSGETPTSYAMAERIIVR